MNNIKNKKKLISYIILISLILNLVLIIIDKFPVIYFVNGVTLIFLGLYHLKLESK